MITIEQEHILQMYSRQSWMPKNRARRGISENDARLSSIFFNSSPNLDGRDDVIAFRCFKRKLPQYWDSMEKSLTGFTLMPHEKMDKRQRRTSLREKKGREEAYARPENVKS
jgi:hypothetical protein